MALMMNNTWVVKRTTAIVTLTVEKKSMTRNHMAILMEVTAKI